MSTTIKFLIGTKGKIHSVSTQACYILPETLDRLTKHVQLLAGRIINTGLVSETGAREFRYLGWFERTIDYEVVIWAKNILEEED